MKYFTKSLLFTILIITLFSLSTFISPVSVQAQSISLSQFVELLISIGVIPADRIVSARAMVTTLSQSTTTPTVTPVVSTNIIATSTSYIQVFTPNGGERWEIDLDVPYTITWGSSGLNQARVALVSTAKNIGTCNLQLNPISTKNGENSYKILLKTAKCFDLTTGSSTPLQAGTYKAKVYFTDSVGTTLQDESNATFKINPWPEPKIKLTYPNGNEKLVRNTEYAVKYTLTDVDDSVDGLIYYYLLDNNGNTANNGHKALRSGTFDYELPSSLSAGAYKLKLKLTTKDERIELEDISDNFFWISTGL